MTATLVKYCDGENRDKLFLYSTRGKYRRVQIPPLYLIGNKLGEFVQRNRLVADDGKPLHLTMASFRPTGLSIAHSEFGYDIQKTQILANHASVETTRLYVDGPAARELRAAEIGKIQVQFVAAIKAELYPSFEEASGAVQVDAANATASGFNCKNPLDSPMAGQQPGKLCTAWLGCFTCPRSVIPPEPQSLARLLQTQAALVASRRTVSPDRWFALYEEKLAILERDILPQFSAALMEQAWAIVPSLPPVPDIE